MKHFYLLFITLFIVSCSDNPVNNTNPVTPTPTQDSLLYSRDSIGFALAQITNVPYGKTFDIHIDTVTIKKIKIQFTAETNFDSTSGLQNIYCYAFNYAGYVACNKSYSLTFGSKDYMIFYVEIFRSYNPVYKYICAKNIKVYKTI